MLLSTHQTEDVTALCQTGGRRRPTVATLFDGTPAALSATGAGRVWLSDRDEPTAELSWVDGLGRHRHIGEPPPGADVTEPTLEDGYLLLVGHHQGEDEDEGQRVDGWGGQRPERTTDGAARRRGGHRGDRPDRPLPPSGGRRVVQAGRGLPSTAPARGQPGVGTGGGGPGSPKGALLVRHPAFIGGLVVFVPLMALIGMGFDEGAGVLSQEDGALNLLLVPLGWSAIVAANLCTLRSRRYGTDELLGPDTVPVGSRTAAHLLACLATLPVSVGLAAAFVLQKKLLGWEGWPRVEVFALGPLIVLGGAVLGVAVARWLPWAVFGWLTVIATFMLQVAHGEADPRWRWLHFARTATMPPSTCRRCSSNGTDGTSSTSSGPSSSWPRSRCCGRRRAPARSPCSESPWHWWPSGSTRRCSRPHAAQADTLAQRLEDPLAAQTCEPIGAVDLLHLAALRVPAGGMERARSGPCCALVPDQVVDRPGGFVVSQRPASRCAPASTPTCVTTSTTPGLPPRAGGARRLRLA